MIPIDPQGIPLDPTIGPYLPKLLGGRLDGLTKYIYIHIYVCKPLPIPTIFYTPLKKGNSFVVMEKKENQSYLRSGNAWGRAIALNNAIKGRGGRAQGGGDVGHSQDCAFQGLPVYA